MKITKNDLFSLPRKNGIVMHVDMNSYFASCEQQANPAWRGKPLGVCSYLHPKGTLIAASIEAKKMGIKTGTKVWEARLKCPSIVLVRDEPDKYRIITRRLRKIFESYSSGVSNYSIDESFLKFSDLDIDLPESRNEILKKAQEIKSRIGEEVGEWLKCSIGISSTMFFAKIASDYQKPDGLTVIDKNNVDLILNNLELLDIWGISWGLKRRLNSLGIFSPLNIKYTKPSFLFKKMGKIGYFLWSRLNGLEIDNLTTREKKGEKSIGHSYTLIKKTEDKKTLSLLLLKLCEKIGRRLRKSRKVAKVCWLAWTYVYGGGFGRQEKMAKATDDSWEIFQVIYKNVKNKLLAGKISKIFISVSGLEDKKIQLSLLSDELKKDRLVRSMDIINDRYGDFTLVRGGLSNWSEEISDRVAFGN